MKAWLIALVLALFVSGCATPWAPPKLNGTWDPPGLATVCIELPPSRTQEAVAAVKEWNRSLKQWRVIRPIVWPEDGFACDYRIRESSKDHETNVDAVAWTSMIGGKEIFLIRGKYEKYEREIVMHELAHALGAQHVPGTLMDKEVRDDASACPDRTTVAQVAAWNRVDIRLLSWCLK